jgi:hypothetical protein
MILLVLKVRVVLEFKVLQDLRSYESALLVPQGTRLTLANLYEFSESVNQPLLTLVL